MKNNSVHLERFVWCILKDTYIFRITGVILFCHLTLAGIFIQNINISDGNTALFRTRITLSPLWTLTTTCLSATCRHSMRENCPNSSLCSTTQTFSTFPDSFCQAGSSWSCRTRWPSQVNIWFLRQKYFIQDNID